jgi:hypothetical protein
MVRLETGHVTPAFPGRHGPAQMIANINDAKVKTAEAKTTSWLFQM